MSVNETPDDPFGEAVTPSATPSAPAAEAPITAPRGGVVSSGGRNPIRAAPPLPEWESPDVQDRGDGADGEVDYTDLAALNRDLNKQRVRMSRIRREMRRAGREAVEAKINYGRAVRRALVQQTGGSAESRKAMAELLCEDLEADSVTRAQVADEFSTLFRNIRDDIENAKVVAYNLRAIANVM